MTLHAYCIHRLGQRPGPAGIVGLDGAPVRAVGVGGLEVWVSEAAAPAATVERLLAHERVLRHALRGATPLPLRFGTRFPDERELSSAVAARADEFAAELERLEGHVEMALRVARAQPEAADADPALWQDVELAPVPGGSAATNTSAGRAYLEARRREVRLVERAQAEAGATLSAIDAELADLGCDSVSTVLAHQTLLGTVAHLVHRAQLRPYGERIDALRRAHPELHFAPSGPWAPYSFVRR